MDKTDVKLTDISVLGIMNKKQQVQCIPLYGLLLTDTDTSSLTDTSLQGTVVLFPSPYIFSKFKPLNTDTPLIRTLFMVHSVSVLRLLTGFDCEGNVVQVTFAVCRKYDFTSLKCLCKIFRGKQCVLWEMCK